jgi:hypothetical protein
VRVLLFPQLPEDDPIASLRLIWDYLRDLVVYFSPIKIAIALVAFTAQASAVAYWALGFDPALSWASDFVSLSFAVVGIVVSVKKFGDEHQAAVIAVIVIVGILGTVALIETGSAERASSGSGQEAKHRKSAPGRIYSFP